MCFMIDFLSDPIGKYLMVGSKMIYLSSTVVAFLLKNIPLPFETITDEFE
jgi:hypothetical protein